MSRSDRSDSDVILAFITSYRDKPTLPDEFAIYETSAGFAQTGLKKSSVIKLDKLATVERSILLGELGKLPQPLLKEVDKSFDTR